MINETYGKNGIYGGELPIITRPIPPLDDRIVSGFIINDTGIVVGE